MSSIAQRYDLSAEDRDVVDRILRKRVSEDAVRQVIKRMGTTFGAHMDARLRTLSPELGFAFQADAQPPGAQKPAASDHSVGLTFHYPEEQCRLILHLDREGANLLDSALLGADPEMDLPAATGPVSHLELGVLHTVTEAANRTRQTDQPLLGFNRVNAHRGDDAALANTSGDALATLTFSLTFGVNRAWCWLDIPHRLLIELSARLAEIEAAAARSRERRGFNVPDFTIDVDVVLPLEGMTLEQIARLKPGDVIEGATGGGGAVVRAKGRNLFAGQIGRLGQANAARVTGPIAPLTAAIEAHVQQHSGKGGK